ncbi:MAG TPA: hypothetical protein VLA36_05740 [Longimicrobiales bacterium]|nr:hypothetical protein [Longimicrobiales bacterium]
MKGVNRPSPAGSLFRRVGLILLAVLAMIQVTVLLRPGPEDGDGFRTVSTVQEPDARLPIASELGPFRDLFGAFSAVPLGEKSPHVVVPTRADRRSRRAFEGAPPFIPHPLEPETERTQDCAPCHEFGGYNPLLRTYAPRAPHPEKTNCLQCHVRPVTTGIFVESDWVYVDWPPYGAGGVIEGSPPTVPHSLQMREHCLACHGGAAAAPDIRTPHPERFNCRQCHVPAPGNDEFVRPSPVGEGR